MKTKKFSIELSDEAETDFDKSFEYYLKKTRKLQIDFLEESTQVLKI